ncbi:DNA cytosine methyltransferase [Cupriavidus sp. D39]|nr:DNA cytosine methyltransferase [Cupriavidus sp. D39]MCY0853064.1 DNA cytosine methyltransferase [Cupriavidus sp. D39]
MSHALHAGLQRSGVPAQLAFANEIREDLMQQASTNNDAWSSKTVPLVAPMQELAFDERAMSHIPKVDVLEAGIPCSGASRAGKAKRGLKHEAEHPEVGHLVVGALVIIAKVNPAIVVVENVPGMENTETASILRNQLRDMGYDIHERMLNGKEWGALEHRNRWCMVAVTEGIEIDLEELLPPDRPPRRLGEVLEDIPSEDPRFREYGYLKDKLVRDQAEGKNFAFSVVTPDSDHTGTINKTYSKAQSTGTYVASPTDPSKMRLLTAGEHASLKGVPPALIEGLSNTIAHEMLGQAVLYEPFQDLGQHMGNSMQRLVGRGGIPLEDRKFQEVADELKLPLRWSSWLPKWWKCFPGRILRRGATRARLWPYRAISSYRTWAVVAVLCMTPLPSLGLRSWELRYASRMSADVGVRRSPTNSKCRSAWCKDILPVQKARHWVVPLLFSPAADIHR